MREKHKIEPLIVDFYEAEAGWLRYKLTIGQQSLNDSFSHVFDPLSDLKHWLEAISIGVQQTSFHYNNEGNDIKFDFERVCWDKEILTISEAYEQGEIFIKANIDRRQIVKAFYFGLLTFSNSDKFVSKEWEVEYLKERLCKILKIDEKKLIEQLTNLNKNELTRVLFYTDESFYISLPLKLNVLLQDIINYDKGILNEIKKVETPADWNIPDDYDIWSSHKKREFITDNINVATFGYGGMKLNDFRSTIIDKYLYE